MLWQAQGASLSEQREQSNTDMNRRTAITYFQIRQVAQREQALQKAAVIHTGQLFCSPESKQTNPTWKKWQWAKQAERAAREIGVVILNTFLYCIFHCWRVFTSFNCDWRSAMYQGCSFCSYHSPAINATSIATLTVTQGDNWFREGPSTCPDLPGHIAVEYLTQERRFIV